MYLVSLPSNVGNYNTGDPSSAQFVIPARLLGQLQPCRDRLANCLVSSKPARTQPPGFLFCITHARHVIWSLLSVSSSGL